MSENLILGCLTMVVCLTLQCIVVCLLLLVLLALEKRQFISPTLIRTSFILLVTMVILFAGNLLQITLWAQLFVLCGEFEEYSTAFYHSVVNFTTLGYGDVVMSEKRRLLGALEAANGVLMFALTSGVIFSIFYELAERAWELGLGRLEEAGRSQEEPAEVPMRK